MNAEHKAETIALALDGKRSGRSWFCFCPAHADTNTPNLHVTPKDGVVLVYCFTGCNQRAVIEALKERGLW